MNIGVLGTGMVGETIASALVEKGHMVKMGSRSAGNEKANEWVKRSGELASQGDFNDAASFGDIAFLCLNGEHAMDAIRSVDPKNVSGKVLIDLTNPLDFSKGMPPHLIQEFTNGNSLGEAIQKALPDAFVVKTLNTVNAKIMVNPSLVHHGVHTLFVCGNDAKAKNKVKQLLSENFGWKTEELLDLGTIETARLTEAYVPFWVGIMQALGTPMFNVQLVK